MPLALVFAQKHATGLEAPFLIAVFLPVAFCLNVYLDVLFTAITPIPATAAPTTGALFKGAKAAVVRMCLGMIHGVVQRVTQRSYTTLSPKRIPLK